MSTKLGRLGRPRVAIALVWFIPANSSEDAAPEGAPPEPEPIAPEEIEFVRQMTGLEPGELVSRLRAIGENFRKDPAGTSTLARIDPGLLAKNDPPGGAA